MTLNLLDLIRAAGPLLWVLVALSVYVVYLVILRSLVLGRLGRSSEALIERARAVTAESGPLAALLGEDARLYAGLSALGTAAQIGPLLGLLGTVIGMVRSFLVYSQTTSPTSAQLATGISEALINTAGGLIVAIVAYVARNALRARADAIAGRAERVREELPGWLIRPVSPQASPLPGRAGEVRPGEARPVDFSFGQQR